MARIYIERQELPEDVRRLFDALWDDGDIPTPAECSPPVDVVETETGIEILVDLPGVATTAVQVVFTRNVVLIAGHKVPAACHHEEAAFHLAERGFGRFARAVRLDGAFDASRATAILRAGELRVAIPQIDDRRGREIRIPVRA
jgi:HSP20 family protein